MTRVHNFSPGPSMIPLQVLEWAQAELVDFAGSGMSVMELSHRGKVFEQVHERAKADLRELLGVPDGYRILFLQGGASLQFAMVPMNLLGPGESADYVVTGTWSEKAIKEAKIVGKARVAATSKETNFDRIPDLDAASFDPTAKYVHITTNNTIFGTQYTALPDTGGIPLVADMSSDILCGAIDVSKFGLIYAGAQKNLGPSGTTLVIVKESLLGAVRETLPTMMRYQIHIENDSMYNTPPTFGIYMIGLTARWIKEMGGVSAIERRNREKAAMLYAAIDGSGGYYRGHAQPGSRSTMNVTFRLPSEELEKLFVKEAAAANIVEIKGHRSVGGMRASIYNAMEPASVKVLVDFMAEFRRTHG